MPIGAMNSIAGPLASALEPRRDAAQPTSGINLDGLDVLSKPGSEVEGVHSGPTFGEMLQNAIGEVNHAQLKAGDLSSRFAAGENVDVHQVMIASQEASVALNLALQVRNKVVDGYQELLRVSV